MNTLLLFISMLQLSNPFLCGETVTVKAEPKHGYRFVEWSDGVTEAEREVELTSDSTLTARFEKSTPVGIEQTEVDSQSAQPEVRKVLINQQLFILRDDKTWTITGQEVK